MIHPRRNAGFTLIELMIVVAIIAIIAAVAIPRLMAARVSANEASAISTLRSISTAQSQVQSSGAIDTDNDGAGEYAFFNELSGATPMRVSNGGPIFVPLASVDPADRLNPAVLSAAFGNVAPQGFVTRSGYNFQIFLPDNGAVPAGVAETTGTPSVLTGPNNCEVMWCAYAWPAGVNQTGNRTFFTNQEGDLLQTQNRGGGPPQYSGVAGPAWSAAYTAVDMRAAVANGVPGSDLNVWVVVTANG